MEHVASAPGRVNLIGEHTDHNGGLVLPVPIARRVEVRLTTRADDRVRVATDAPVSSRRAEYHLGEETRIGTWPDHVHGITRVLREAGHTIGGFDARIATTLPIGAGLGSSAALAVALLRAIDGAFALALDPLTIARLAHRSEVDHVGARVGFMDQLAASFGTEGAALFIDFSVRGDDGGPPLPAGLERIPLPSELELLVVDSGVRHEHATGGYNTRRAECEEACRLLGVRTLTEAAGRDLGALPAVLARRVRHVTNENARVREAVAALRTADVATLGTLLTASHGSLRDDFEVSTPELDALVDALTNDDAVLGARLVGGGFGGSVLALVRPGSSNAVGARFAHLGRIVLP